MNLKNYTKEKFGADLMAGVIVGIVAIPLAIAFGIASGVGPTEGLITAIIAGFLISIFGGSKTQIGGPTGAFVVIIYGIIQQFGLSGLMIATIMAGIFMVIMGVAKLGGVIKFVPYPVVVGFTGGIAVTIFSTQINDFFGMSLTDVPADFISKWTLYFKSFGGTSLQSLAVGLVSLIIIIFSPKVSKKIPGSLIAIVLVTIGVYLLKTFTGFDGVATIGDRYELPNGLPMPHLPALELKQGQTIWNLIQMLFPAAFTIAMLGSIESLLSAVVADGMTGDKHNSNKELIGQGIANIVTPFFGGIPATGAIARTMTNINNGGRTPVAGVIHAIVVLLVLLFLGPLVGYIPMPCLAAVLIIVAYNMSGWKSFVSLSKGPKSEFMVLMVTFVLTVILDLTIAIEVGIILALVLFLKRASEVFNVKEFKDKIDPNLESDLETSEDVLVIPEGINVYEIDGPYFFGMANKFEELISRVANKPNVRIIRMRKVPFIDSTGLHNLENLIVASQKEGVQVVLSGVNEKVRKVLEHSGVATLLDSKNICPSINIALERAKELNS